MSIQAIRTFFSNTAGTIGGAIANAKASENAVISGIAKAILTKWTVVLGLAIGAGVCGYKAYYNFQAYRAGTIQTLEALDAVPAEVTAKAGDFKKDAQGADTADQWTQDEINELVQARDAVIAANAPKVAANDAKVAANKVITDAKKYAIVQTIAAVALVASAVFVAVSV